MINEGSRKLPPLLQTVLCVFIFGATTPLIFAENKDVAVSQLLDAVENDELGNITIRHPDEPRQERGEEGSSRSFASAQDDQVVEHASVTDLFDPTVGILDFHDQDILDVLHIIGEKTRFNIIADDHIRGRVTVYLDKVDVWDALRTILEMNDLAYARKDGQVTVMTDDEFAALYGRKFNDAIQTRLIPLEHGKPAEIVTALLPHKSEQGKIILIDETKTLLLIDEPQRVEAMADLVKAKDVALETQTFVLLHVTVPMIKDKIEKSLSQETGVLLYDPKRDHQLTVTDTAENLQAIAGQIAALDKEIQIAFVGQIIKIVLDDKHQQGIDWPAIVSNYQSIDIPLQQGTPSLTQRKLSLGTISQEDSLILLEALRNAGTMQTIGGPSVTVKLQQKAGIPLALTEPFQALMASAFDPKAKTVSSGHDPKRDFHLELSVMPVTVEKNVIQLELNPQFHWLSGTDAANKDRRPFTASSAQMALRGTEMIVLGGLFQEKNIPSEKKVPLIGDLPIIGSFFRRPQRRLEKTEFVIFLTPKIMIEEDLS